MINSNQKKFLVLYLIPASVVEKWSKTDPNERKAAEEKNEGRMGQLDARALKNDRQH